MIGEFVVVFEKGVFCFFFWMFFERFVVFYGSLDDEFVLGIIFLGCFLGFGWD